MRRHLTGDDQQRVRIVIGIRRTENDADAEYLERTAARLRHMASTHSAARDANADEVRNRLRHMTYGSPHQLHTQVLNTT